MDGLAKTGSHLYEMKSLPTRQEREVAEYTYFLTACGSDFRAYQVLRRAKDFGISLQKVLAFDFQQRHEGLDSEGMKAYSSYHSLNLDIKQVTCSIIDPPACVKSLSDLGFSVGNTHKVAIDISCFTKPYFFCILKYLKEQIGIPSVTVYYTEPLSYVFPKGLYHSYHSTFGPLSVMEIPGFPGNDTRTSKKVLVVLLGFDGELSFSISDEVAPEEIILVNGFPAYAPKFKDISLINNERLLSPLAPGSIRYARANNPFETYNLLEELYSRDQSVFFNVAPIGTKPMALGACLFALAHPSVRVVYPLPEKYAHETTKECWNSWSYEMPLKWNNQTKR
jgi:hypothetical protein